MTQPRRVEVASPPSVRQAPFFIDAPIANVIHATGSGPFSERRQRQAQTDDPFKALAWMVRTGRVSSFHWFIGRAGQLGIAMPTACMAQHCSTRHLWRDRKWLREAKGRFARPELRGLRERLTSKVGIDIDALRAGYGPINQRTRGIELLMTAGMQPTIPQLRTLQWLLTGHPLETNIAHSSLRPGRRNSRGKLYDLTDDQFTAVRAACREIGQDLL